MRLVRVGGDALSCVLPSWKYVFIAAGGPLSKFLSSSMSFSRLCSRLLEVEFRRHVVASLFTCPSSSEPEIGVRASPSRYIQHDRPSKLANIKTFSLITFKPCERKTWGSEMAGRSTDDVHPRMFIYLFYMTSIERSKHTM
ncbi:hypothetical protein KC340_g65 [Hortaea werneckii]|nr:hypothetical protein KC340_g65 [Hortaea werneckii]